jgi:hypothetical protein
MFMAALSAALLVTPLWAQHGGRGGMGGGFHGGSGRHGGGGFAGAPHGGGNWGGGFHGGYWHGPGHFPYYPGHYPYWGWRYPWWGYRGYYGYGGGYSGWYGGVSVGYYPSGYYSSGWYSDPATQYPVYAYANPDNTNAGYNQQQEIDRLNNEVSQLRAEQQSSAVRSSSPPRPQIQADTVLVFRDRHTEEIQNHAITGKTLWVFTEQRARKIPIAELNVPATTKANEARGIDFRLPGQ